MEEIRIVYRSPYQTDPDRIGTVTDQTRIVLGAQEFLKSSKFSMFQVFSVL